MPTFTYRALTETGDKLQGILEADTLEAARTAIQREGYIPYRVRPRPAWLSAWSRRIQALELGAAGTGALILFTRQLRSLLKAGIPIIRALDVVILQTESRRFQGIIRKVLNDVDSGTELSSSLAKHPHVFPELYVSTVRAGEAAGALPEVLERLSDYLEFEDRVRRDVKSALRYPIMVVFAMTIVAFIFTLFVVPRFAMIFSSFKLELPLATRIVLEFCTIMRRHIIEIAGALALVVCFIAITLDTGSGRRRWDALKLRLPVFGDLFQKVVFYRFAWILKVLYESGVSIVPSLAIVARTVNNRLYEDEFMRARERVEAGESLSSHLQESPYFPPMIVHMIATGEKSGSLDQMLEEITRHYDTELKYKVRNITTLIEPLVTVFLGGCILLLALAILLPMWNLVQIVRQH